MISFMNSLAFFWISRMIPEKKINSFIGFRTKKSMESQEKWDRAQEEMINYSRKLIFPSIIFGILFFLLEIYFLFVYGSENLFAVIMVIETIISVLLFFKMYNHVSRSIT
ncbi:SdpI family protein [Enterococcus diestrammenae]